MSTPTEKNRPDDPPRTDPGSQLVLYTAAAILDARGTAAQALLIQFGQGPLPRLLALGSLREVQHHPAAPGARRIDLPAAIILPGLVNAHTHLDLTHIGPKPHDPDDGFVPWINTIRINRSLDPTQVEASVARGAALLFAGGTVAVGDIAGSLPSGDDAAGSALTRSGILGASFLEFFAIGNRLRAGLDRLEALIADLAAEPRHPPTALRRGLQPHAPYTVDLRAYQQAVTLAAQHNLPIATHLAETPEEWNLVARAQGPLRSLLENAGIWDASVCDHLGTGRHPVEHLAPVLREMPFLLAHVNDADDAALELLASTAASVAYCPRASAYFGSEHHFGPHRYRDMLSAGITVALGTDSIVNLPPTAADPALGGISILDEMRLLHQRDGTDPLLLLHMATLNGARALGLPQEWFTFTPGHELAGALAVPLPSPAKKDTGNGVNLLAAILQGNNAPILLFAGNRSRQTGKTAAPDASNV